IPNETFQTAAGRIKEGRRRVGFANDQFKKLPADHSSVKAAANDLKAAVARLDAAEKALDPFSKASMKQVDPGSYPDFKADNERLKELTTSLQVGNMQYNRAHIAELVRLLPAVKAESTRLEKKYAP